MCVVVNKHYQEYDVYIGRGSKLGNPYTSIQDRHTKAEFVVATREESIARYRPWLWKEIKEGRITLDYLRSLDGKRLGCFCAPKPCHGDIIVQAVAWAMSQSG